MTENQPQQQYALGMIGLGVMGRNMLLNMADHGFPVAGYDKDSSKVEALRKESAANDIHAADNIKDFIGLLRAPRAVMMLVPAGPPVDSVIADLLPHLEKGDLIIDAGNSYFKDTNLRARNLVGKGIQFLGVGISGGEEGARHGPSIMPGGPKEAYERVRPLLEAVDVYKRQALLNDGAILSIAYDNVHYKDKPEAWNMRLVLGISTVLGVIGVVSAFGLFYLGERVFHLDRAHIQTLMYLKLSVACLLYTSRCV